jgi:NADH-quinone oxidoreductase subunit E/NADP-reducing hydrogenase subunit HndA
MPNCKTLVPFRGTKEQEEKLKEVIAKHKGQKGATMPVMQEAQEIYGYLPEEVQIMIAEGLGIPLTEVYGISSFYSQFTLNPKGEYQISVCLGTACYVKGARDVLDKVCEKLGVPPAA